MVQKVLSSRTVLGIVTRMLTLYCSRLMDHYEPKHLPHNFQWRQFPSSTSNFVKIPHPSDTKLSLCLIHVSNAK